jgi:hypothetical protein
MNLRHSTDPRFDDVRQDPLILSVLRGSPVSETSREYAKRLVAISSRDTNLLAQTSSDISTTVGCVLLKMGGEVVWLDKNGTTDACDLIRVCGNN